MGGVAFTILCDLSFNGNTVSQIYALPNTGANGFAFIDTRCAKAITTFLGTPLLLLESSIRIRGYDGQAKQRVSHYLLCNLVVDQRRLPQVPFLVLDLGNHDLILGSDWFSYYDVKPDMRRRKLLWPESLPVQPHFAREIRRSLPDLYD
jgi:hypothetical protein